MNRRDAIKALVALPEVARISTAPVKPTDVIVVECDKPMTCELAKRIEESMKQIWPCQKVVVLSDGLKLKIVEGTSTT